MLGKSVLFLLAICLICSLFIFFYFSLLWVTFLLFHHIFFIGLSVITPIYFSSGSFRFYSIPITLRYIITKLSVLSPPKLIPLTTAYLQVMLYYFRYNTSTSPVECNWIIKTSWQISGSLSLQICPLFFVPVNSWPPCIPSSVLQLGESSGIYLVSPLSYIQRFSSLRLFAIFQGSLLFVTRLSMSC